MRDGGVVRVIALEYHDVVAEGAWDDSGFGGPAAATYKISVAHFDEHLRELERVGCKVVTSMSSAESPIAPVMLTFDDGGSGYVAYAADLLERRGWYGCVFVTTGWIGKPGFLTASDIRSLHQRGHSIGTHSRTHPTRLSALTPDRVAEEWRLSIADLEDVLGAAVQTASVPGGYHSRMVALTAAANGLTTLFTSEPESRVSVVKGCAVIGRYTLRRGDRGRYAGRLVAHDPRARVAQWVRWNAKKLAKSVGGSTYLRLRDRMLGR